MDMEKIYIYRATREGSKVNSKLAVTHIVKNNYFCKKKHKKNNNYGVCWLLFCMDRRTETDGRTDSGRYK